MYSERIYSRREVLGGLAGLMAGVLVGCGDTSFPTPNPTIEATTTTQQPETPTPTSTETATPTPTEVPEPEGARGNVESIDQLNIPEAQKEAIYKMLENATPQIIVEKDGQVVIIAIDNEMLEAVEKGERLCPSTIGSQSMEACRALSSVRLNLENFPDADDRLVESVVEAKYQAYMNKSGITLTKEEYLNDGSNNEFLIRARNVFSDVTEKTTVGEKSPVVYIVKNTPDDITVEWTGHFGLQPEVGNGVIGLKSYSVLAGMGIKGEFVPGKEIYSPEFAYQLSNDLAFLSHKNDLNVIGGGYNTMQDAGLIIPMIDAIRFHMFDLKEGEKIIQNPTEWPSIFRVEGIIPSGAQ